VCVCGCSNFTTEMTKTKLSKCKW